MSTYYVIEASFGPRIEQSGLRYGNIDAETPYDALRKARTETDYYGHARIEIFDNEESYRRKNPPLTSWEDSITLASIVRSEWIRKIFEEFFVNPIL